MAVIIPPGYAHVFWRFVAFGDPEEMLTSCGVAVVGSPVNPALLAEDMFDAWTGSFPAGDLSNLYAMVGTRVYVGQDGDPLVAQHDEVQAGTSSSTFLPSNCSLLVQKRTALGGRRNRGRFFIPAGYLHEAAVDTNGQIASGSLATYQGNATDLFTAIDSGFATTSGPVILHGSSPTLPTAVTSFAVAGQIATQRTRMRR